MRTSKFIYISAILVFLCLSISSCEEDDDVKGVNAAVASFSVGTKYESNHSTVSVKEKVQINNKKQRVTTTTTTTTRTYTNVFDFISSNEVKITTNIRDDIEVLKVVTEPNKETTRETTNEFEELPFDFQGEYKLFGNVFLFEDVEEKVLDDDTIEKTGFTISGLIPAKDKLELAFKYEFKNDEDKKVTEAFGATLTKVITE